jgi:hypothetical protein
MTPQHMLDLWGSCAAAPPRVRAHLLAAAADGADVDVLARRPLGEWQAALVQSWHLLLDTTLAAIANCPACDALCEVEIAPDVLPLSPPASPAGVVFDGRERVPRLLTPADLDAIADLDHEEARTELARRALGAAAVPGDVQRAVAAVLEAADPSASWWVKLFCPDCWHAWEEPLDLAAFLWDAVDDAAGRLLADVADLAAAFGWTERDVLALPPARRAAYLGLAGC